MSEIQRPYSRLKDACSALGLKYHAVWWAHRRGDVPAGVIVRVGRALYVHRGRLEALLATGGLPLGGRT